MSTPGSISLQNLIYQAQFRADMLNSQYISQIEWATYANASYKELYDLLVAAYGNDYPAVTPPFSFVTTQGQAFYPLPDGFSVVDAYTGLIPPAFYKMLGLDLQINGPFSGNGDSNVTLKPFTFQDRNKFAVPNFQSFYGVTNLRYRIYNNQIWLTPIPSANQVLQLYYLPEPTSLVTQFFGIVTLLDGNIVTNDISNLALGMTLGILPQNGVTSPLAPDTTITSLAPGLVGIMTSPLYTTPTPIPIFAYDPTTLVEGVSGWEEYIIVDMAIKALVKEDSLEAATGLSAVKEALRVRIMAMADTRDAGSPARVNDSQFNDFGWGPGNTSGSGTW